MSQSDEKQLLRGEFIGKHVRVLNKKMQQIAEGTVMWETRNMMQVGSAKFEKKSHLFMFKTSSGEMEVDGARIAFRPEDRIKRLR